MGGVGAGAHLDAVAKSQRTLSYFYLGFLVLLKQWEGKRSLYTTSLFLEGRIGVNTKKCVLIPLLVCVPSTILFTSNRPVFKSRTFLD